MIPLREVLTETSQEDPQVKIRLSLLHKSSLSPAQPAELAPGFPEPSRLRHLCPSQDPHSTFSLLSAVPSGVGRDTSSLFQPRRQRAPLSTPGPWPHWVSVCEGRGGAGGLGGEGPLKTGLTQLQEPHLLSPPSTQNLLPPTVSIIQPQLGWGAGPVS